MLGQTSGRVRRGADVQGGMADGGAQQVAGVEGGDWFGMCLICVHGLDGEYVYSGYINKYLDLLLFDITCQDNGDSDSYP